MRCGLILSGAFVRQELMAEFGLIPPSFLPLGNRRLFEHQRRILKSFCEKIYLSLPYNFEVSAYDAELLEQLEVEVIRVDDNKTIAQAFLDAILKCGLFDCELIALYGDTLIENLAEIHLDTYSAHVTKSSYFWASAPIQNTIINLSERSSNKDLVVSGLFSFSSVRRLAESLANCANNIIDAVSYYNKKIPMSVEQNGDWYDFGHVQTYYTSCGLITTQRSFNSLVISHKSVTKISEDSNKMLAEASWFENIPPSMRVYTPAYLDRIGNAENCEGYSTENTYMSTLANLAIFGRLNQNAWSQIFNSCKEFLHEMHSFEGATDFNVDDYYQPKTDKRLKEFASQTGFDLNGELVLNGGRLPFALELSRITGEIIRNSSPATSIVHGDFCFSNIFYDFRSRRVKVIDPRGVHPNGEISIYGDPRYDIAKLAHSVIGRYDWIISGQVDISQNGNCFTMGFKEDRSWRNIEQAFQETNFLENKHNAFVTQAILVQLFLSMLPLHADYPQRQVAFLANAARLFEAMEI